MTDKDIAQIRVAKFAVSIIGLNQLMEEMAATHGDKPDDEVGFYMLDRLGKSNYIPESAKEDYLRAFVREFQKFLGRPFTEDPPQEIDVKVLGAGCNQCHSLSQMVMDILTEIKSPAAFEHVTDIREIARYGLMGSPALVINGKAVAVGSVPPRERVKKWLIEASECIGKNNK
jgi:hypothetical protein